MTGIHEFTHHLFSYPYDCCLNRSSQKDTHSVVWFNTLCDQNMKL